MTRAEFIREAVKQLWGATIADENVDDALQLTKCDGIKCPEALHPSIEDCITCPYKDFWEKEV